jgi:hypothetical protein
MWKGKADWPQCEPCKQQDEEGVAPEFTDRKDRKERNNQKNKALHEVHQERWLSEGFLTGLLLFSYFLVNV